MLVKTFAAAVIGIDAVPITIEVSSSRGTDFTLVGLPDSSVKESRERISSALTYSGSQFPRCALVINMAPADIRKEGAAYDLPLAIGILASNESVKTAKLSQYMIMGELSLDGSLQPVRGVLPMALCARKEGYKGMILPAENAGEAAVVDGLEVLGMNTIREVIDFFNDEYAPEPALVDVEAEFR
ncbi:MAG: magnesium chelatase, partial [Paludibacteraceae bacterium]|nr:magnesium chelatase [Paludibacteraceae bacterium]